MREEKAQIVVSVVIPVYNAENYIKKTVTSILEQSFQAFQIILVNDGSTDGTLDVLKELQKKDSRIVVLNCENGGPSRARNIGMKAAEGEWIQFMDADDYIESDMMQAYFKCTQGTALDLVVSGVIRDNITTGELSKSTLKQALLIDREAISRYLKNLTIATHDILLNYVWNKWIRRDIILKNNIEFDEALKLGEDYVFNCSVMQKISSICVIEECFYHYCIQGNESLVLKFNPNELERRKFMDFVFEEMLASYGIEQQCRQFMNQNAGRCYLNAIYKACTPACCLGKKDKLEYIRGFISGEEGKKIQEYLLSLKGSRRIKNFPKIIACKMNNPYIMYILAKVHNM